MMKNEAFRKNIFMLCLCVVFICIVAVRLFQEGISGAADNGECHIEFDNSEVNISSPSMAVYEGSEVIIGKEGNYYLSGEGNNITVKIDTADTGNIVLNFDSLRLTHESSSPFCIMNSGTVYVMLKGDNVLTDGKNYIGTVDGKPNACFYSKNKVNISGSGSLTVNGNYHHGISVRSDLSIDSGKLNVYAAGNGIDSNDAVLITGGDISINALGDGINAKNSEDAAKGSVLIAGGNLFIKAEDEGIQALNRIEVKSGKAEIESKGLIFKTEGEMLIDSDCVKAVSVN